MTGDETPGLSKFQVASRTSGSRSSLQYPRVVKKQLDALPTIGQQAETQVNSAHEDKENVQVTLRSNLHSNVHSTADFRVRKCKLDK